MALVTDATPSFSAWHMEQQSADLGPTGPRPVRARPRRPKRAAFGIAVSEMAEERHTYPLSGPWCGKSLPVRMAHGAAKLRPRADWPSPGQGAPAQASAKRGAGVSEIAAARHTYPLSGPWCGKSLPVRMAHGAAKLRPRADWPSPGQGAPAQAQTQSVWNSRERDGRVPAS